MTSATFDYIDELKTKSSVSRAYDVSQLMKPILDFYLILDKEKKEQADDGIRKLLASSAFLEPIILINNYPHSQNYKKIITLIQNLSTLEQDWDSYGAEPISSYAINQASELVVKCEQLGIFLDFAAPMCDGGIQLEGADKKRDIFLEIEIIPERENRYLVYSGNRSSIIKKGIINEANPLGNLSVYLQEYDSKYQNKWPI